MTVWKWPVAECLHENRVEQVLVRNYWGVVVRLVPERCTDCGHIWPARLPR